MKKLTTLFLLILFIIFSLFIGSKLNHDNKSVFKEPTNDKNSIIAAFIYGELSSNFPTTNNYSAEVECESKSGKTNNANGEVNWNGSKWVVSISNIDAGDTICNVYFDKPMPKMWKRASSGQLLYGIKNNQMEPYTNDNKPEEVTLTTPGREMASTDEGIRETPDDYGTSYYYRGAVENNYVVFANMCWRIVRITGDGSVKLVLYNYNSNSVSNPCSTSEDATNSAFARVNNSYTSAFNSTRNKNTYIGYMYSNNPDSTDFDIAQANNNDSTILTFLKTWYDEKLRGYNNLLADVIWCNDKSIVTDTTYDPWYLSPTTPTGTGTNKTYYQGLLRLYPVASANPSLVCPNTGTDGKLSKFTARDGVNGNAKLYSNNKEYKIGLLTADEVAFAGGASSGRSSNIYLSKNTNSSTYYWNLTPNYYGTYAVMFQTLNDGTLGNAGSSNKRPVRPAIALKSDVKLKTDVEQNGTSEHPFVVNEN